MQGGVSDCRQINPRSLIGLLTKSLFWGHLHHDKARRTLQNSLVTLSLFGDCVFGRSQESSEASTEMSGYKHVYFPIRGRGERTRLAFVATKVEFEDVRVPFEDWQKEKECK